MALARFALGPLVDDEPSFCVTRHLQIDSIQGGGIAAESAKAIKRLSCAPPNLTLEHALVVVTSCTTACETHDLASPSPQLETLLKRGKLTHAGLRAVASCDQVQFDPVTGPSRQVRELCRLDQGYAAQYMQLLRDVLLVSKVTDLHAKYPHEYNSHRSRLQSARVSHTYFAQVLRNFREWLVHLGPLPEAHWTVDNIEGTTKQGYRPGNVRWASKRTQRLNQRRVRNRHALPDGRRFTTAELAKLANVRPNTVSQRLHRGWSVERILQISQSYRTTWTFPPDLMMFEPEYRKRRNRERGRLDWLIEFLERKLRSDGFWIYQDQAAWQAFFDLMERLEAERQAIYIKDAERQQALTNAMADGARAYLAYAPPLEDADSG